MINKIKNYKDDPNKNYYLVMGIIIAFLVFMVGSVMLVSHQVNGGSSAERLNKKLKNKAEKISSLYVVERNNLA